MTTACWKQGTPHRAAFDAELARDVARLAEALVPHEARLVDEVAAVERIEAAIRELTTAGGTEPSEQAK